MMRLGHVQLGHDCLEVWEGLVDVELVAPDAVVPHVDVAVCLEHVPQPVYVCVCVCVCVCVYAGISVCMSVCYGLYVLC